MASGTRVAVSSCENGNLYQADFCKEMLEQMLVRFFKGHVWTSLHVGKRRENNLAPARVLILVRIPVSSAFAVKRFPADIVPAVGR